MVEFTAPFILDQEDESKHICGNSKDLIFFKSTVKKGKHLVVAIIVLKSFVQIAFNNNILLKNFKNTRKQKFQKFPQNVSTTQTNFLKYSVLKTIVVCVQVVLYWTTNIMISSTFKKQKSD
jgi:hypothetical protein